MLKQMSERNIIGLVKEGNLSISEAAKLANLVVGEMMELLIKNGVKSDLTIEDVREQIKAAEKILLKA